MGEHNLKIIPYYAPNSNATKSEQEDFFMVDFNPNTFTINSKIEFDQPQTRGTQGGDPVFNRIPPIEFSIEFTIDGTGVGLKNIPKKSQGEYNSQNKDYVKTRIRELRHITGCQINGTIHRPNYLAVNWGTFHIECILTALNITYNLFDDQGSPLRAKVSCSFVERMGPDKANRKSSLESPDLTKYKPVLEGDLLPYIVKNHYHDSNYYIQVARANKLKNFRNLEPGTKLILPPLKKN